MIMFVELIFYAQKNVNVNIKTMQSLPKRYVGLNLKALNAKSYWIFEKNYKIS